MFAHTDFFWFWLFKNLAWLDSYELMESETNVNTLRRQATRTMLWQWTTPKHIAKSFWNCTIPNHARGLSSSRCRCRLAWRCQCLGSNAPLIRKPFVEGNIYFLYGAQYCNAHWALKFSFIIVTSISIYVFKTKNGIHLINSESKVQASHALHPPNADSDWR